MTCRVCGGRISAVIHEDIGRAWLHDDASQDSGHEADPALYDDEATADKIEAGPDDQHP